MQNNKKQNLIVEITFEFAITIIHYATILENKKCYVIARQLLKSGTSIGANVREAQNAESLADFIHKMKIAAKEADETEYWLLLCNSIEDYPDCNPLLNDCHSIIKVLAKIIGSSKRGMLDLVVSQSPNFQINQSSNPFPKRKKIAFAIFSRLAEHSF